MILFSRRINKFTEAMQAALYVARARFAIQELTSNFQPKNSESNSTNSEQSTKEKYVEIFIDESGEPKEGKIFVVAGLALVHDGVQNARDLHDEMEKTEVDLGTRYGKRFLKWYGDNCMPKRLGEAHNRHILFEPVKEPLKNLLIEHTSEYLSFAVFADLDNLNRSSTLKGLEKHHLDNAYYELFEWLVDAALYEFLPEKLGYSANLNIKIYGATRMRPKDGNKEFTEEEIIALKDNWGISAFDTKTYSDGCTRTYKYQSLDRISFMPLIINIMTARPDSKAMYMREGRGISGAVGFSLKYENEKIPKYLGPDAFRHAHYLADLAANFTYISIDKIENRIRDAFKGFFKYRFVDEFDGCFKATIDASKYLESNLRVQCFLRAVAAGRYHQCKPKYLCEESIVDSILCKISNNVNELTRDEFNEFTQALPEWWGSSIDSFTFPIKPPAGVEYTNEKPITIQNNIANQSSHLSEAATSKPSGQPKKPDQQPDPVTKQNHTSSHLKTENKKDKIILSGFTCEKNEVVSKVKEFLTKQNQWDNSLLLSEGKTAAGRLKCLITNIPADKIGTLYKILSTTGEPKAWTDCNW